MPLRRPARLPLLALALLAAPAAAQVGHPPTDSPYRDLRFGQFLGATAGWFGGAGGQLGIAPHKGTLIGARYEILGAGTLGLGLAVTSGGLERLIVDADDPAATRVKGPVSQRTTFVEGVLQFNLTGGKTWRGLAPFVSGGFGLLFAGATPADTSGFKFRTKFALTPGIGTRLFLSERLFLRLEARNMFYQVSYPDAYFDVPSRAPGEQPVLFGRSRKEWVTSGWYSVGLHYAFYRPF